MTFDGTTRAQPDQNRPDEPCPPSMHDRVASWCDCCPCEPEDRWAELADEMGVDLSDHDIAGADPAGSHS